MRRTKDKLLLEAYLMTGEITNAIKDLAVGGEMMEYQSSFFFSTALGYVRPLLL